jgi:CheY-like chemotaxis protein
VRILIADDSDLKINELKSFFHSNDFYLKEFFVEVTKSFKTTVNKLIVDDFDLVLLDMTMPTTERSSSKKGVKTRTLAGKDVLTTLKYNEIKGLKCVIFSQFSEFGGKGNVVSLDDIYQVFLSSFPDLVIGCVQYNTASLLWRKELNKLIQVSFST